MSKEGVIQAVFPKPLRDEVIEKIDNMGIPANKGTLNRRFWGSKELMVQVKKDPFHYEILDLSWHPNIHNYPDAKYHLPKQGSDFIDHLLMDFSSVVPPNYVFLSSDIDGEVGWSADEEFSKDTDYDIRVIPHFKLEEHLKIITGWDFENKTIIDLLGRKFTMGPAPYEDVVYSSWHQMVVIEGAVTHWNDKTLKIVDDAITDALQ